MERLLNLISSGKIEKLAYFENKLYLLLNNGKLKVFDFSLGIPMFYCENVKDLKDFIRSVNNTLGLSNCNFKVYEEDVENFLVITFEASAKSTNNVSMSKVYITKRDRLSELVQGFLSEYVYV